MSITYGVGKAANAWLKAGRPEDVASFREVFEKARKEGAENAEAFSNMDCKDEPLGDESKKFDLNALKEKMKNVKGEDLFAGVKTTADKAESTISQKIKDFNDRIVNPLKSKSDRWISAQNWQQLSRGELVIPYSEIKSYMTKALAGSDFALLDIGYLAPDYLRMNLQHNTYGTLELKLSILDFFVDQNEAVAHIKVDGFDIFNNDFASLVVNTVGDKLIVAIIEERRNRPGFHQNAAGKQNRKDPLPEKIRAGRAAPDKPQCDGRRAQGKGQRQAVSGIRAERNDDRTGAH